MPDPELLERDEELAILRSRLDLLAATGVGGAVLIEGVAGIGKTSLMRAFAAEVGGGRGPVVLRSQASELELELAFGSVRQLLTAAVLDLPEPDRVALLAGPGAPAGAVLGLAGGPSNDVDPLYSLFWVVATLAERAPLVLLLDDAHWLDPESARFVGYLARRVQDLPVLVVAAARTDVPDEVTREALGELRQLATVLVPAPLSPSASAALVDVPDAHQATGGNPLLLLQLARSPDVARGLASAVTHRVELISPEAVALAEALSLFGGGATLQDAAAVAGLELAQAAVTADALVAEQIVAPSDTGTLEFTHPLLRSILYDRLGTFTRRAGHARAATVLRARGADAEHVAAHLLAGEPAGDLESVEVLRSAAASAEANLAPRAGARYLERALAEGIASDRVRRQLLLDLGRLQRQAGDHRGAQESFARAFAERDSGAPVQGAVDLALAAYLNSDHRVVREVAEAIEDDEGVDADDKLVIKMLLAESAWNVGEVEACMRLIDEVPEDLPGTTPAQRFALSMVGTAQVFRGEPTKVALDTLLRSVGEDGTANLIRGIEVGDPFGYIIFCDGLDEAQAIAARRLDKARASGDEVLFAWTQNSVGWILMSRGDLSGAEAAFRLGLAQPALSPLLRNQLSFNYVETLICRGDLDEACVVLDEIESGPTSPQQQLLLRCRRAEVAVWRGDFAAALPAFEEREAIDVASGMKHPNARIWTVEYADALAGAGRRSEAIAMVRELVELSSVLGGVSGGGYHQLTLGRLTGEVADLERAVAILEPSPFRWYAARAQLELGAALRRDGQRVKAREHLRLALDYAERNRVRHFSARAREELRLAGAKPRKLVLTGVEALTPAEHRIVLLAAEGRTNKEIAQHLFLTVKTIEATLVRAYRKLGVSTRGQLAQVLAEPAPV